MRKDYSYNTICCICGKQYRKSIKGVEYSPDHYSVHGKGKCRVTNWFHRDCYYENSIWYKERYDVKNKEEIQDQI